MRKKVAFCTLGCKVNYCETEALQSLFEQAGYQVTDFNKPADVYVINTCTVTHLSDHKSRKMIRRARRRNPDAVVVATGCYVQGFPEQARELAEADLLVGTHGRENLPALVETVRQGGTLDLVRPFAAGAHFEALPLPRQRGRTRGFLKIQEGCEQSCSYCIVPAVRGPVRSLDPEEVFSRAAALVRAGCREIVLTGIHLGLYGQDLPGGNTGLPHILERLETLPRLLRIRLSSLEPTDITGDLIEKASRSKKICPHLHIPLQSGDDEILRRMNRPYNTMEFACLVKWLREKIPGVAISTDVIVGFPGETEEHHRRSVQFITRMGFSRLHVFRYSARPGTAAAGFPHQVPVADKERRSADMLAVGAKALRHFGERFINTIQEVLVEKVVPRSHVEGFTAHYLRARVKLNNLDKRWRGRLIRADIQNMEGNILRGVPSGMK